MNLKMPLLTDMVQILPLKDTRLIISKYVTRGVCPAKKSTICQSKRNINDQIRKLKRNENLSVIPFKIFNLIEIKFMPNLILFNDSLAFE